jgi:hypothetical protein
MLQKTFPSAGEALFISAESIDISESNKTDLIRNNINDSGAVLVDCLLDQ